MAGAGVTGAGRNGSVATTGAAGEATGMAGLGARVIRAGRAGDFFAGVLFAGVLFEVALRFGAAAFLLRTTIFFLLAGAAFLRSGLRAAAFRRAGVFFTRRVFVGRLALFLRAAVFRVDALRAILLLAMRFPPHHCQGPMMGTNHLSQWRGL
jgi:hypothetical protein